MSVAQEILAEKSNELVAETQGKQKTSSKKASSIKDLVVAYKKEIAKALPEGIDASRFERMVQSALSANEDLQKCTPMSILAAMLSAAQLGLEPNTPLGQAYLIPFKAWKPKEKKEVLECQFQIGYKGLLELAYRTGNYKTIDAHAVYEMMNLIFLTDWTLNCIISQLCMIRDASLLSMLCTNSPMVGIVLK